MKKIIIVLFVFLSQISLEAYSQADMIGYSLYNTLPQANSLNPAFLPHYKVTVGLPGLSGFRVNSSQNFTNLQLLTAKTEGGAMDLEAVYDGLKRNNRFTTSANINLLHVGIRGKKSYSAFNVNTRTFNRASFPRELVDLLYYGNASSEVEVSDLEFSRLKFKSSTFTEIGFSHGREFLDGKLTLGARLKYLIGHSYSDIEDFNLSLKTYGEGDSLRVSTEGTSIRSAGAAAAVLKDQEGDEIISSLTGNGGFGLDLGATYSFSQKIKFFASVNDLGFINWKSGTYSARSSSASYTFTGADLIGKSLEDELDSVYNSIEFEEDSVASAFSSALTANVYLGGEYQLTPKQKLTALLYGEFYKGSLIPAFSAMYNFQHNMLFNSSLGLTVMNGRIANVGAGFTFKFTPFQLYLASNDLISLVNPMKGKAVDLRFGINLTFGDLNKSKRKGKKTANDTIDTIDLGID